MAHVTEPRIGETSTTAGAGPWTTSAALTAHRRFSAVCSVSDTVWIDVEAVDGSGLPTGDWAEGLGTYSAANEITMTTVYRSSNSNLAVTFPAGTLYIRLIADARQLSAVPRGGSSAQLYLKTDATDYNAAWTTGAPSHVNLANVTNDAQTKAAIVPNTAPAAGEVPVGNAGGTAYAKQTISGDATLASTGALTIGNAKVSLAKIANAAANSKLLGSGAAGSGSAYSELTLGTNLSMSGTTLNAAASPGGSDTQIQFNDSSAFGGDSDFTWDKTTNTLTIGGDVPLTRKAAATFQFGAADAASPVAQTIVFQGSRGGTDSNVAAVTATIQGSLGTGTGTVGDVVIKTGTVAASGSTQHTAATRLTINSAAATFVPPVVVPAGSASATSVNFGTAGCGMFGTSATIQFSVGGSLKFYVDASGPFCQAARGWMTGSVSFADLGGFGAQVNNGTSGAYQPVIAKAAHVAPSSTNGQSLGLKCLTELTTIAAAATTDTTIQMPAGAIILAVSVRVTTAITCTSTFNVGDSGSATRFGTGLSKAVNTTNAGTVAPYVNASALSVRITPDSVPSDATGRLRVTIYYFEATVPTS